MLNDRSATLLVRVWLEDDGALRARLTAVTPEHGVPPIDVATVASARDVLVAVRGWLEHFERTARRRTTEGS